MHFIQIHRGTPAWEALAAAMAGDDTNYQVRIAVDGQHGSLTHHMATKIKVNEHMWSAPLYAGVTSCDCAACNTRNLSEIGGPGE